MMNGVTGVNVSTQNNQMTFGNKLSKSANKTMEIIEKTYEDVALQRMMKEDPEKAKVIIHNRIISSMNEAINDIFRPKNLIKMTFDTMTIKLAIGVGKILSKCDKAINKIPFVKEARINARNKKLAKFEENIKKRYEDGVIDADQAGVLLTNKNKGQELV